MDYAGPPALAVPAHPTLSTENERWEYFKPIIQQLYVEENEKLVDLVRKMKNDYEFDAVEHQYKHHFRKWNFKKNIPASKKASIWELSQTRAAAGKQSAVVKYKGKKIDVKRLERHLKSEAKQEVPLKASQGEHWQSRAVPSPSLPFGNKVFLMWNIPYGAMQLSKDRRTNIFSPAAGSAASTPSDILVDSPSSNPAPSPQNTVSAMATGLRQKSAVDRAHLFVQGKHGDLAKSMNGKERKILSTWLYQFWLFSFSTAKHWGRGPRDWTAYMLGHDNYQDIVTTSALPTPDINMDSPRDARLSSGNSATSPHARKGLHHPSPHCRWSIHAEEGNYDGIQSPPLEQVQMTDPFDERTWKAWPGSEQNINFVDKLRHGLESNDFSNIKAKHLPLEVTQISKAAERSPHELLVEAFGFSIMSRNIHLVWDMFNELDEEELDMGELYPFHIATSYLDGSDTCCNLLSALVSRLVLQNSIRRLYTNHLGHTVLDNLMIAIIKGHSSCAPGVVDKAWERENRFAGEEVDICGRWDADSSCVRELSASGSAVTPVHWKHKFCHTSAQTICHCINTLFLVNWAPDINTISGLFVNYCLECGVKLQPYPLHTLILSAFALAQSNFAAEDLFGILACALCLLCNGADPLLNAHLSLSAISGAQTEQCDHTQLTPVELAGELWSSYSKDWPEDIRTGWSLLYYVLRSAEKEWQVRTSKKAGRGHAHRVRHERMASEDQVGNSANNKEESNEYDEDDNYDESDDEFYDGERYYEDDGRLRTKQRACQPHPLDHFYCDEHDGESAHRNFFGQNKDLGTLWAVVQAEMLTYRPLKAGDPWVSSNFCMQSLVQSLETGGGVDAGLVGKGLLKPFAGCGDFDEDQHICPTMQDVSACYFANLDDWGRSNFLAMPQRDEGFLQW